MLLFSERKRVEDMYYKWLQAENKLVAPGSRIVDSPMTFLCFLRENGWIDEDKIKEDLRK